MSSTDSLRISDFLHDSVVDGPGLRFVVFFQGCSNNCPGCHNPQTHDPDGGRLAGLDELLYQIDRNSLLRGVTFSGGEPFLQADRAAVLAREVRKRGLDVWCYTGMTWEQLTGHEAPEEWRVLLGLVDVLVDGPYLEAQRSLEVRWRGSRNQRLIDVPSSLKSGSVTLWTELD